MTSRNDFDTFTSTQQVAVLAALLEQLGLSRHDIATLILNKLREVTLSNIHSLESLLSLSAPPCRPGSDNFLSLDNSLGALTTELCIQNGISVPFRSDVSSTGQFSFLFNALSFCMSDTALDSKECHESLSQQLSYGPFALLFILLLSLLSTHPSVSEDNRRKAFLLQRVSLSLIPETERLGLYSSFFFSEGQMCHVIHQTTSLLGQDSIPQADLIDFKNLLDVFCSDLDRKMMVYQYFKKIGFLNYCLPKFVNFNSKRGAHLGVQFYHVVFFLKILQKCMIFVKNCSNWFLIPLRE
ncbi:hypothetical protein GEMRC1_011291 [Eukaryota sp. GEM-RC1]